MSSITTRQRRDVFLAALPKRSLSFLNRSHLCRDVASRILMLRRFFRTNDRVCACNATKSHRNALSQSHKRSAESLTSTRSQSRGGSTRSADENGNKVQSELKRERVKKAIIAIGSESGSFYL